MMELSARLATVETVFSDQPKLCRLWQCTVFLLQCIVLLTWKYCFHRLDIFTGN